MNRGPICSAVLFLGALYGTQAFAQTAPAQASAADPSTLATGQLQEVVVTAEKRSESAQKTPISMSVISAEDIVRKGIGDFAALATNDTSVNFSENGAEPYLTVRGVSSQDTTEIGDPAVPVVIDGFTTIRTYSLTTALYDLKQIEVLRGPQGTLYGRNAEGGLVNIITQNPTRDFGVGATAELGNFNTNNITAWINMPVSDTLRLRISGESRRHDGYRTMTASDGIQTYKADDENSHSMRFQAEYTPFSGFDAWFLFQSTQIDEAGPARENILFNPGITPPPTADNPSPVQDISHNKPYLGNTNSFPSYGPASLNIDDKVYKWRFTFSDLPAGMTLTYLGGYDNTQWHHDEPFPTLLGEPITVPVTFNQNEYPKTTNNELRLASDTSRPLVWQAGLYYFEERSTDLYSHGEANPQSTQAMDLISFEFPLVDTKSRAAYGQASYSINDQNKVSLGARYSKDTKSRNGVFNIQAFGIYGLSQAGNSESSKTTMHVGYDWTPTQKNLVYAKFDTGYKPGGFTTCNPYKPESVNAFEIGSKNRLGDNAVQLNGDVFYEKFSDQQVSALSASCASGTIIQNAGSSRIYGAEFSLDAYLTRSDKVDFAMTLLHARFVDFLAYPTNGAPTYFANCPVKQDGNCQLAGNSLPQAPDATIGVGYSHNWMVSDDSSLSLRLDAKYETKQYFDSFNFNDSQQAGYGLFDAYFGYTADRWSINIYGRNLTNKTYLNSASEITTGGSHVYAYGFGVPRTFGVQLQANLR
jgi:iron complex outermembrane recepter protein